MGQWKDINGFDLARVGFVGLPGIVPNFVLVMHPGSSIRVSTVAMLDSTLMTETIVILLICSFFPPRLPRLRFCFLPGSLPSGLSICIAVRHPQWQQRGW